VEGEGKEQYDGDVDAERQFESESLEPVGGNVDSDLEPPRRADVDADIDADISRPAEDGLNRGGEETLEGLTGPTEVLDDEPEGAETGSASEEALPPPVDVNQQAVEAVVENESGDEEVPEGDSSSVLPVVTDPTNPLPIASPTQGSDQAAGEEEEEEKEAPASSSPEVEKIMENIEMKLDKVVGGDASAEGADLSLDEVAEAYFEAVEDAEEEESSGDGEASDRDEGPPDEDGGEEPKADAGEGGIPALALDITTGEGEEGETQQVSWIKAGELGASRDAAAEASPFQNPDMAAAGGIAADEEGVDALLEEEEEDVVSEEEVERKEEVENWLSTLSQVEGGKYASLAGQIASQEGVDLESAVEAKREDKEDDDDGDDSDEGREEVEANGGSLPNAADIAGAAADGMVEAAAAAANIDAIVSLTKGEEGASEEEEKEEEPEGGKFRGKAIVFSEQDRAKQQAWAPLHKEVTLHELSSELADHVFAIANQGAGPTAPIVIGEELEKNAASLVDTLSLIGLRKTPEEFLDLVRLADSDNSGEVFAHELNYAFWSLNFGGGQ